MMTVDRIKQGITVDGSGIYFDYHDKECGIDPNVQNGVWSFDIWFGEVSKQCRTIDETVHQKIFDGKSLVELVEENAVDVWFG